jgi:hypothetical protein
MSGKGGGFGGEANFRVALTVRDATDKVDYVI